MPFFATQQMAKNGKNCVGYLQTTRGTRKIILTWKGSSLPGSQSQEERKTKLLLTWIALTVEAVPWQQLSRPVIRIYRCIDSNKRRCSGASRH